MKMRFLTSLGVFAAMTIGASIVTPTATASGPSATVGLHNTTAGVEGCPAGVGLAWHFVAPPKSKTDFISITLVLDGDTVVINSWLEHPLSGDAYVTIPGGYTVTSLQSGTFVVTDSSLQHKNVRLSHTCDGDGPDPSEKPPEVRVTKTAAATYVDGYDWTIDKRIVSVVPHAASADVNYAIDVTKSGLTTVPGSYEVKGVITVENLDLLQYADISVTENGLTTAGATCSLDGPGEAVLDPAGLPADSADFGYTCTGIAGIPAGSGTNTATATVRFALRDIPTQGTVDFDWGDATVRDTLDETATLTDDNLPGFSQQFSTSGSHTYTKNGISAGGGNCDPGFTNTATLVEDDTLITHMDSVTVQLCTTTGGHTIGYWFAAPAGNAQTLAAVPSLKLTYGNVLGSLNLSTAKRVKDFGSAANCSGDCKSMLQAQFIATAMSVRTGAPAFGNQCVYVPGGGTSSISGLLAWINTNWTSLTTAQRIELKNVLDAVNNNAALACVTIV